MTPSLFSLLFEETVSSATVGGLALYDFYGDEGSLWFVIYRLTQHGIPHIQAEIEIERSGKCSEPYGKFWEVKRSAAEHGYGPLIYEIALSSDELTKNNGVLIPDSISISRDAQGVWNKFYKREDIEVIDLEQEKSCSGYRVNRFGGLSQGNFKAMGIRLKEPLDVSSLIEQHEKNLERIGERIEYLIQQYVIEYFEDATHQPHEWEEDIDDYSY